jgi:hypothetical protein
MSAKCREPTLIFWEDAPSPVDELGRALPTTMFWPFATAKAEELVAIPRSGVVDARQGRLEL